MSSTQRDVREELHRALVSVTGGRTYETTKTFEALHEFSCEPNPTKISLKSRNLVVDFVCSGIDPELVGEWVWECRLTDRLTAATELEALLNGEERLVYRLGPMKRKKTTDGKMKKPSRRVSSKLPVGCSGEAVERAIRWMRTPLPPEPLHLGEHCMAVKENGANLLEMIDVEGFALAVEAVDAALGTRARDRVLFLSKFLEAVDGH